MATEVLMPRQGQSVESCIIIEWKVNEGDVVEEKQPLCEVETDKATFEVEAPAAGTVLGIFYPADADVEVLKPIAAIGEPGEDISSLRPEMSVESETSEVESSEQKQSEEKPAAVAPSTSNIQPSTAPSGKASPRAKNLAAEKGVDVSVLGGSGPEGRVIERDVKAALEGKAPLTPAAQARAAAGGAVPNIGSGLGGRVLAGDIGREITSLDFPGAVTEVPVKGVRKLIAGRMLDSLQNTAQVTLNASADARSILDYRAQCKAAPEEVGVGGINLNDSVLYIVAQTLGEFPGLNAHFADDKIKQFAEVHLGFAVDTPRGLMVPVIRHANRLSLQQISMEAKRLGTACIEGTIEPDLLGGATFTISNLGVFGVESFTPVLNPPEV
ncbi:MAG TPA: dihydrolipoamide acetyltransferase family protein, partial [Tichowtungia sp.]|nr:dihydrolipoamide acetyltransferase family protein [Tichowtungia sp.]